MHEKINKLKSSYATLLVKLIGFFFFCIGY